MKHLICLAIFSLSIFNIRAQVIDRYPYVQSPDEHSVIIAWRTATAGVGTIAYGLSPTSLTDTMVEGASTQKHVMYLTGLSPNTRYYYKVHSSGHAPYPIEFFSTAMPDTNNVFKFLHYGDCGFNNTVQRNIAALMAAENPDFAVVTGDVDQGSGSGGGDNYDDIFFSIYANQLSKQCHYTAIGNHDNYYDGSATYLESFYLPHNNPTNTERYYSFIWGNAKFVCLDPRLSYAVGSEQYRWLEDELRCNDREWLFCYFHEPAWTNYWSLDYLIPFTDYFMYGGNADMRTTIVPLFEQYDVDYVLNGHTHLYQKGAWNGVKYIISGGSAQDPGTNTETQWNTYPQVQMVLKINQYVSFSIHGDTASFKCIDIDGVQRDAETNVKPYTHYKSTFTVQNVTCKGMHNGTASISTVGPKSPYTYEWSTGDTTALITALAPGTYTVTVYDRYNCAKIEQCEVTEPDSLQINFNHTNATCNEISDGALTAIVSGGTSPYRYFWSTGDSIASINSLDTGIYTLMVMDTNMCYKSVQTSINALYAPIVHISGDTFMCLGDTPILSASPFTAYMWNTGSTNSTSVINYGGNYTLLVTDSIGCKGYDSHFVAIDSTPKATFNYANSVRNFNFLSFTNNASSYRWNFGDGSPELITTSRTTVNHVYANGGYYDVTLVVSNSCGSDTITKTVLASGVGILTVTNDDAIRIAPNPFTTYTQLYLPESIHHAQIMLFDMKGQCVLNDFCNGAVYRLEKKSLQAGTYMVHILDDVHHYKTKVIVE